ncbi:MAG: hypothetical protein U1A78_40830 [Polyangia bacterium]
MTRAAGQAGPRGHRRRTSAALLRTALSSAFVLLMLASGHLLMVAIGAAEVAIEAPRPATGPGAIEARLLSDLPLRDELEAAHRRARGEEPQRVLAAALADARAGRKVPLYTLPVTPFLVHVTLALTALGGILLWLTSRLKSDAAQSILGVFAGNMLWTGGVEYGLTLAARSLGVAKTVGVVNGQLVAIYGEYVLLKHSWGALVLIMGYLCFLESSRCPLFLWWRERVPTMRGPLVAGHIYNYGPRSAFQYATTVWGFYLLLLWAYDEHAFGVYGAFTTAVLFLSLAGSLFCLWRLHQQTGWGAAVRYAVGAMIVVWTPIEIAGKWGLFREPWLLLRPTTSLLFFGGLALGTALLWRAQRRVARAKAAPETTAARGGPSARTGSAPGAWAAALAEPERGLDTGRRRAAPPAAAIRTARSTGRRSDAPLAGAWAARSRLATPVEKNP